MLLTPLPLARVAHAFLGVMAMALGVGLWVDGFAPEPVAKVCAVVVVGIGAVVAVRSFRIGVECRNGAVRVRGLLRSRLVSRTSIEDVTGFPALRWRDGAGRRRWTPMAFFVDSAGAFGRYRRHNAAQLGRLRTWIARPHA